MLRPFDIEEAIAHPERVRFMTSPTVRATLVSRHGPDCVAISYVDANYVSVCAATVYFPSEQRDRLRLAPAPREIWLNVYPGYSLSHASEASAERSASAERFALYKITDDGETATIERIKV